MADLAQPLLPQAGHVDINGGNSGSKLTAESPFADSSQQDLEAARPAARKEGEGEDASAQIARQVALAIWLSLFANVLLVVVKAAAYFIRCGDSGNGKRWYCLQRMQHTWSRRCPTQATPRPPPADGLSTPITLLPHPHLQPPCAAAAWRCWPVQWTQ